MPDRHRTLLRAACFDFDGVIVDSEPLHFESERRTLAVRGIKFKLEDKVRFVGGTVRGTAERICAHYGIADVDGFYAERQAAFDELVKARLHLMPGAREALDRLREAGVPLALVSSGERGYIHSALAAQDLQGIFRVMITQQDVRHHKPDPEPYLLAAERLGYQPAECMAIEDSPAGVASAGAAGMYCVAVPSPATAEADFSDADLRLSSLADLDSAVSGLFHTTPR